MHLTLCSFNLTWFTFKVIVLLYQQHKFSSQDIKARQGNTDEMFEPLKETIELLKTYDQEMPDEIYKQLEVRFSLLVQSRVAKKLRNQEKPGIWEIKIVFLKTWRNIQAVRSEIFIKLLEPLQDHFFSFMVVLFWLILLINPVSIV